MGRKLHYRPGSFYRADDRTGFPQRAENTRQEWTGLYVDTNVWEARQPQDLVRGVKDIQSVPQARPLGENVYVGPISQATTAAAVIGQKVIALQSVEGFYNGAEVGCMLDSGTVFFTTVAGTPAGLTITLAQGLPYTMASGNLVTNYKPSPPVELPEDDN